MIAYARYYISSISSFMRNLVLPWDCIKQGLFIVFFLLSLHSTLSAQTQHLSITATKKPLSEIIDLLEKQTPYRFVYRSSDIRDQFIDLDISNQTFEDILPLVFEQTYLSYSRLADNLIALSKGREISGRLSYHFVSGVVFDENGISVPGVNIREKNTLTGTVSDKNVRF